MTQTPAAAQRNLAAPAAWAGATAGVHARAAAHQTSGRAFRPAAAQEFCGTDMLFL